MHAQQGRGLAQVPVARDDDAGDEMLLELALGVLVADPLVDHFTDELLQPIDSK